MSDLLKTSLVFCEFVSMKKSDELISHVPQIFFLRQCYRVVFLAFGERSVELSICCGVVISTDAR